MMMLDNFLMNSFPENIKKEIEQIQKLILPLAKKTSKYMFWTFPLIGIAVINLIVLLFFTPKDSNVYILLFVFAIIGAVGFALLKEAKINRKEIRNIGLRYIIERINKSSIMTDERKKHYIRIVNDKPILAMEHFVKFLQEEDRMKRMRYFNQFKTDEE